MYDYKYKAENKNLYKSKRFVAIFFKNIYYFIAATAMCHFFSTVYKI